MNIGSYVKNNGLFFLYLVTVSVILGIMINEFQSLPSPLFGGDYYYQLGHVNHFLDGGSFLSGSNIIGGLPGYLPLYPFIVSLFAKIFALDGISAMIYAAILFVPIAILFVYRFMKLFFDTPESIITMLIVIPLSSFIIFKYSTFSMLLIMPLFFVSLYKAFIKPQWIKFVWTGILLGVLSLSHTIAFIAGCIVIGIAGLYTSVFYLLKKRSWNNVSVKKTIRGLALILFVGALIGQLYWFKPLFVYHGHTPNPYLEWNAINFFSFSVQLNFFINLLKTILFNKHSIFTIFSSLFFWLGLVYLFALKHWKPKHHFILIIIFSTVVGAFHYFLTVPLLGTHFYPPRFEFLWFYMQLLVAGLGIGFVIYFLHKKLKGSTMKLILFVLGILLLVGSSLYFQDYQADHRWYNAGRGPLPPHVTSLARYITEHTDYDAVILSNNELSFMINAVTGRKIVTTRRAQNSPFLDMDQRVRDSATILYGNSAAKRVELIEKYNISYFYWDQQWLRLEYHFNDNKEITGHFDPMLLFKTPQSQAVLETYNITYQEANTFVDPSIRGDDVATFDLYMIFPHEFNIEHPWHPGLDDTMREIWNYTQNGQVVSRLYEFK